MRILCFEIQYVGFGPYYKWKKLAKAGLLIDAIRKIREEANGSGPSQLSPDSPRYLGLREAKAIVDSYMVKHHIERKYS